MERKPIVLLLHAYLISASACVSLSCLLLNRFIYHSSTFKSKPMSSQDTQQRAKIMAGFKIESMVMKDGTTKKVLWTHDDWSGVFGDKELQIKVPKSILSCQIVNREMTFSSQEAINDFTIEQIISLGDRPIELWKFQFGFVIPGSTNTWDNEIESAGQDKVLPAEVLSGNVIITSNFYDGEHLLHTTKIRVFYE